MSILQVFLEPEGRTTPELYVQGFSTGLPERLQLALLHTLPGAALPCPALPCPAHPCPALPGLETRVVLTQLGFECKDGNTGHSQQF